MNAVRWRWVLAMVVVAVLTAGCTQIAGDGGRAPAEPAPGPAPGDPPASGGEISALNGLRGPPTLFGRVSTVLDPATVMVQVGDRPVTVRVVGVDVTGTPACAQEDAAAFARRMLIGQTVTLVPDPTLPARRDAGAWPAYVVLASQQSYTDAVIRAGWVGAGVGRYRAGFLAGQQQAQQQDLGMWGPPCNRPGPS